MRLAAERLLEYSSLGTDQEASLPTVRNGNILSARVIPVDAVRLKMQNSAEHVSLLFTPEEIAHSLRYKARPYEHFAARLAAKQIVLGFLGSESLGWQDVSVKNNDYNSPFFIFSSPTQDILNCKEIEAVHLSLSHDDNAAVAFCAVERSDNVMSGIVRIGTDICSAHPFQALPIPRTTTFNEEEIEVARQQEFPAERFAMYYAAKESVIKVLETLSGWIWKEIQVYESDRGGFYIELSGSARERLEQMGAAEIVTSLLYREEVGALAFSVALTHGNELGDCIHPKDQY